MITWLDTVGRGEHDSGESNRTSPNPDGTCSILRRFELSSVFALSSVDDKRFLDFEQVR